MKNIILLAPPSGGKGTQSKFICEDFNIPHISTGDLLRNAVLDDTEKSMKIKKIMSEGNLVDDNIILELLNERLDMNDTKDGYVLDGFPRNLNQAKLLDKLLFDKNQEISMVLLIDTDYEVLKNRVLGRIYCPKCMSIYNVNETSHRPKIDGKCDKCNSDLIKRNDDNEVTFTARYNIYEKETKQLIKYYESKIHKVNGNLSSNDIYKEIKYIINNN